MIDTVLVFLGVVFMVVSVGMGISLLFSTGKRKIRKYLMFLFFLILSFLVGYVAYLISLLVPHDRKYGIQLLLSLMLFFGSVFVLCGILVVRRLIVLLDKDADVLRAENNDLELSYDQLKKKSDELNKLEKEMEDKNKELMETLEAFYELRLEMKDEGEKFDKENEIIRQRLSYLKKQ